MKKFKNTLQKGSVRYIIFKEDRTWYGVALEFNIVEDGDDPQVVMFGLMEAIQGYVESLRKVKARPHALNQKTDPEYEQLWKTLNEKKETPVRSPFPIYTFGTQMVTT